MRRRSYAPKQSSILDITNAPPTKQDLIGSLCYMVGFGRVRGYFDIVDLDMAKNWDRYKEHRPDGFVLVLANWHPVINGPEMNGFQGWRYTSLRP